MSGFSEIIVVTCPYCEAASNFQKVSEAFQHGNRNYAKVYGFFQCPRCRNAILVQRPIVGGNAIVWPKPPTPEIPKNLPENIHDAFLEAERCLINKSFHAAATEARRTLEIVVADLLNKSGENLKNDIKNLENEENLKEDKKDRVLPKAMIEWAHNVRIIGNDSAHNNTPPQYSEEDSREALEFTRMFLTYAFTLPERIKKTREERERREPTAE